MNKSNDAGYETRCPSFCYRYRLRFICGDQVLELPVADEIIDYMTENNACRVLFSVFGKSVSISVSLGAVYQTEGISSLKLRFPGLIGDMIIEGYYMNDTMIRFTYGKPTP